MVGHYLLGGGKKFPLLRPHSNFAMMFAGEGLQGGVTFHDVSSTRYPYFAVSPRKEAIVLMSGPWFDPKQWDGMLS